MNDSDLSTTLQAEAGASRQWKILLAGMVVVLAVGAFFGWRLFARSGTGPVYVTEPVTRGDISLTVTATGNLEPTNKVTVGSELSGTTLEVYVETNDQVTKGQPLATLDTSKLKQQTESSRATAAAARAKVAQVRATLVESEASLARLRKLREASGGRLPSQANMDAAVATADRAKADLESAEAEVRQADAQVMANESDLGKAVIRSPIDGIVLTRDLEPGQTVAASFTAPELFEIAEKLENMKLEVAVAEADIGRVATGQKASFTVDAWPNRSFEAVVKKVEFGSQVTDNVVTYTAELEVSNDDLSLRPGMTATADISVAEADGVLLAPNAALRFDPASVQAQPAAAAKRSFVQSLVPGPPRRLQKNGSQEKEPAAAANGRSRIWVLRDGKPHALPVKAGLSNGGVTEISGEGVTEGLPVIVHAASAPQS